MDEITWKGPERILWGCVLMDLLGESTLEHLPLLMGGARSVETSYQCTPHAVAIRNARRRLDNILTRRAVERAVQDLRTHARNNHTDPSYTIDLKTLAFQAAPGQEARIQAARAKLTAALERLPHGKRLAPLGDLVARVHRDSKHIDIPIRLTGLSIPAPEKHNIASSPSSNLVVTLQALRATAKRLDDIDATGEWKPESWTSRLDKVIHLQKRGASGLEDTDTLDLRSLTHLIGIPGAGKTTLISLLCAHLSYDGRRVAVFFTSIETAREYLERLQRYNIRTALLVGRSPKTHQTHGERLAELIATQGHHGFGESRTGADLFAQTCPLPAFAVNETEAWQEWRASDAPCEDIYVSGKETPHLCPLWSRCGRVKNQRELVHANVWLGHIRSADTTVPAHTTNERWQYFELIAKTFDLVIFDEVDESQGVLDGYGAITLELGGTPASIHSEAQKITGLGMSGSFAFSARNQLYPHHYAANTFERHLIRFYEEIDSFQRNEAGESGNELKNRLLTTNFLIKQALRRANCGFDGTTRSAIYSFWDSAMYSAFFRDKKLVSREKPIVAPLGLQREAAEADWKNLVEAFEDYLHALSRTNDVHDELDALAGHFAQLIAPEKKDELAPIARVLVAVGFTIAAYQQLAQHNRMLAVQGILPDPIANRNASRTLQYLVPRGLLGTFSSVRYRAQDDGSGYVIDYLVLDTTPRLLLQRIHDFGANVLLTSATSWLPDSPAYHVGVSPKYVLQPKQQAEVRLTLRFMPIKHPIHNKPMRFSGAGSSQFEHLRLMVAHLVKPSVGGSCTLERTANAMSTPKGRARKCALVVNSYDQVRIVVKEIARVNPTIGQKTRGILKSLPEAIESHERYILRGQVESLGHDDDVMVVVFPLAALGRGVNIVFHTDDDDNGRAALGSVYFLTRPHPVAGDLRLMLSMIAQETERFDRQTFPSHSLAEIGAEYRNRRQGLYQRVMRLLAQPLQASSLPNREVRPFSANLIIPILQMIGRAIRRSSPAEVYFVDAAWAPKSAINEVDSERSSVLVTMRNLLRTYLEHPDAAECAILTALYGPFATAFNSIEGLNTGWSDDVDDDDDEMVPPTAMEDLGDLDLE